MKRAAFNLVILVASLGLVGHAYGEGGFWPPREMIRRSDFIAIVTIDRVIPLPHTERPRWQFGQRAHAVVERNIKGALPRAFDIYGGENFVCQETDLSPGRYLAFLVRDAHSQLQSVNYQMGIRPLRGESVEWYYRAGDPLGPLYGYKLRWQQLDSVLRLVATQRPNQAMQRTAGSLGSSPSMKFNPQPSPALSLASRR